MGIRRFFLRRREDTDLAREMDAHLRHQVDENIAHGMSDDEAQRQAYLKLGSPRRVREDLWDWNTVGFFDSLMRDLRYALRMLTRNPGFSILAVLCLTLGIGANAAVFSWIEGISLRPFPAVAHQERLVVIAGTDRVSGDTNESGFTGLSWPDFMDLQRNCKLFDSLIADKIMGTTLSIGDRAERVAGSVVSSNYFDALGVRPILGRGFETGEDSGRNAHPVTVISYWMWRQRYRGDPEIIGKTQRLNGITHTIIGVAPDGFFGTFVGYPMAFWVPMSMQETFEPGGYKLEDRGAHWIEPYAILKPGVTMEQAQQEMSTVAKRLEADYLATNRGHGIRLLPLWKAPFNQAGAILPTFKIAVAVVFFVLLIACANVSSLLLVRSLARRHEMTIRLAIGARRGRLVRQLLTEGMILALLALAGGIVVAYWSRNLIVILFPPTGGVVVNLNGEIDWRVLAVSAVVGLISTLLFALAPAIQTSRIDLAGALKSESGSVFGGQGRSRLRSILVLAQVALSFILLVGAVLLVRSSNQLRNASPGFSTDNVLVTGLDLLAAGYDTQRAKNFQDSLLDRVRSIPGVESAALARIRPFSYAVFSSAPITVEGYRPAPDEQPTAQYNQVSPGYFATLGISLLSGRDFTRADNETAPLVAVVNERMVQQYWRGVDPVGKRFQVKDKWMQVVGVAKLVKYGTFTEQPKPFFYVPFRQDFSVRVGLNIRTARDPASMVNDLAREIHALDENLAPSEIITMRAGINRTAMASQQIAVGLIGIFGGLALLLAAIGLYGVMSYAVSQSKRELGLRMALGATIPQMFRLVLSHGLTLTAGGILLGAIAALILTRLIESLLYQVNPRDPLAFGSAFAVMAIASLAACLVPAWRATRIDPVRVLRD